jgi:photosystem II stability/assembly factor-like uncharacterized protein
MLFGLAVWILSPIGPVVAEPWKAPGTAVAGPEFDQWVVVDHDISDGHLRDDGTGHLVTRSGDILKTEDRGKNWRLQWSVPYALRGITFANPKMGWAVGGSGHILHTEDGGESWRSQDSQSPNTLSAIFFRDERTGWSVGDAGTILRTIDGGKSWSPPPAPIKTDARLQALTFIDADQGWTVGTEGTVLYTGDAGATWEDRGIRERTELLSVSFANATRGVASGGLGRLYYTNDGGRKWAAVTLNSQIVLHAAQFDGAEKVWVAGSGGYLFEVMFQPDGTVTWSGVPSGTMSTLRKILKAGTDILAVGENGTILERQSSGAWAVRAGRDASRNMYNAIVWRTEKDGWIATSDGIALKTGDRGVIWNAVEMPWPDRIPAGRRSLNGIAMVNNKGWIVGDGGFIFSTSDGGTTWSQQQSPVEGDLLSIFATSEQAAWAVGAGGILIRTTDGVNWSRVQIGETGKLTSIYFLDENHGWIAGSGGVILSTSNGTTWDRRFRKAFLELSSIFMLDATHGWAAGSRGTVLFTRDGIKWQSISLMRLRSSLRSIRFVTPELGWAVDDRGNMYVSDSGGRNWVLRPIVSRAAMTSLYISNRNFGWAVGQNTIAKLVWEKMPALMEFDAINKTDAVRISGKIAPTLLAMTVKRLEFKVEKERQFHDVPNFDATPVRNNEFAFEWNPRDSGYRDGTTFNYRVQLTDGVYEYPQTVGASFVYKSWLGKFEEDHPFLVPVMLAALLVMLLLLIPRVLFLVYGLLPWKAVSEQFGDNWVGKFFIALASLFVLPFYFRLPWVVRAWAKRYAGGKLKLSDLAPDLRKDYVQRPVVQDAWVARHTERATRDYVAVLEQVSKDNIYVPMPVSVDKNRIQIPVREDFSWLAGPQPEAVVITGAGGSGKSTFAAHLGLWALEGLAPGAKGAMIPLFVRRPTTDLLMTAKEMLKPVVEYEADLDDELLAAVIQYKRVLIIIDSLSEWSEAERTYIEGIRGKMAVGALIITSRRALAFPKARQVTVPGLDTASMFQFREQYLQKVKFPRSPDIEAVLDHGLIEMKTRWFEGNEPTCLLVRMFIDDAIAGMLQTPTPDSLASNAADVIIRYVQRLTASEGADLVLRVAKDSAKEMLSGEFVPQSVAEAGLLGKLAEILKDEPVKAALDKLVAAGIMETGSVAGTTTLQFIHDPVAEFLASIRYCEELKDKDQPAWDRFAAKVHQVALQSPGFVFALQTSLASYRTLLKLPDYMRMTN